MKNLISVSLTLLTLTSLYANDGKTLYNDSNCGSCHGGENSFDPRNEKVKSLHDLKGWVSMCATNLNTGWFPEEEKKVVKYLNETHYKLEK